MNNLLNIKTPALDQAKALKADYSLSNHGLTNLGNVYWNLVTEAIIEEAIFRGEGRVTKGGALIVNTGKKTGRSANDKFVVKEATNEDKIWWGEYNRPFSADKFDEVYSRMQGYLQGRDLFVQDCFAGADPNYRLPVRIITELAWHSHFTRNMFLLPKTADEYKRHIPDFTILALPGFHGFPQVDGTASETFILLNFEQKLGIIGNTAYAGEIKKSIFTVMNYLMPLEGVMSMHCSANQGPEGDTALFFGLSGTGKTTLSADPGRGLIGDDEHGWSDEGIFNYEAGCYAKVIELSPTAEPQIYACTQRFGTVLENVIFDKVSRNIDLMDPELTENTRASYPLEFIDNAIPAKTGGHPRNIILLTCDGGGVMPPIARLTPEQTMYQFISGYTTKIAGTELGVGQTPELTFSTCFGAPFMVHHPSFYANLLRDKINRYGARCWLVNTGWVGGDVLVGKRISIKYTRALLNAALDGRLDNVEYRTDEVFGFQVPLSCPEVPDQILDPASSWHDKKLYEQRYRELAIRFAENFKKYEDVCPPEVRAAGPKVKK
ncbi:MAG: phosphoenolpyruvate carboxykinase (ATP) [Candidatus Zixiibacteriota bacterium]|nr:MAG: phosphoenolpyruvate carboxykinase (ATP) [candidate division Zixibacteria bacterium]